MTTATSPPLTLESVNFEFLRSLDTRLVSLGLMAERYMETDSPSAAVKLRVFVEQIVQITYARLNLDDHDRTDLISKINASEFRRQVPKTLLDGMHDIRKAGNRAAHDHHEIPADRFVALLRTAFDIGQWFVEKFHDSRSPSAPFVDPRIAAGRQTKNREAEEASTQATSARPSDRSRCPIPGCGHGFKVGRSGWDAHVGSPNQHREWQPAVEDSEQRKIVFRLTFPEFFGTSEHPRDLQLTKGGWRAREIGLRCPIPGCTKVFRMGRLGWDAHVASLNSHPDWHPNIPQGKPRKELFREEFSSWFRHK